jgi:amino acid adenylation domain-containing protein/non-ribosomal peptide synthase protein (TIGR01720 family)
MIYTSGSTGKPKGVMVTHANVTRLFTATQEWFHFSKDDVWTLFHSYAFDFSVWEIWGALLYGGRLRLVPYWGSRSPELFHVLLREEGVTVLNQTPSAFRQLSLVEETIPYTRRLTALRWIIFGGEALELHHLKSWFMLHGDQEPQLVNMYGITETTVHVSYRPLKVSDLKRATGSVIGGPIPDLQVYILDRFAHPVPLGVCGEMYVGSAGLARGYLHRPDLTAERFIPNPFGGQPGSRLYKTGDLARWLSDGDIEYLGRADHQVKIRGFRIEIGEIEAALLEHPDIQECRVLAREDSPGDKRLVAYIVTYHGKTSTHAQLRMFLRQHLPEYMVPSAFVILSALPLTANGKIDLRMLPAPDQRGLEHAETFVAPRTTTEEMLATIWADVLRVAQVGIYDNFFSLGGDSILSIQIVNRASQVGLRLTPRQLFEYQTIEQLSLVVDTQPAIQAEQSAVSGEVPLTPIQHWFFEQQLPQLHHWNQSFWLDVAAPANILWLERALRYCLGYHDAFRLRFSRWPDSSWHQVHVEIHDTFQLPVIDVSGLDIPAQNAVAAYLESILQQQLNVTYGPMVRSVLFIRGTHHKYMTRQLLMIVHHLVIDGVSWRILLDDVSTVYQQCATGRTMQLSQKTSSFKQWAEHLLHYAQSNNVRQALSYWLLAAHANVAALPLDYPYQQAVDTEALSDLVLRILPVQETRALLEDVPVAYHTQINDILLTALLQTVTSWTGTSSLLVDLEGHGREELFADIDVSRTVGWFTSLFPVFLHLSDIVTPVETLKTVKEQLRSIPLHGIGYGIFRYLSNDCSVSERLRTLPQAQVVFNYLGQFDQITASTALFDGAHPSSGLNVSLSNKRSHILKINCWINEGVLSMAWEYSRGLHMRKTIEDLATTFIEALCALIQHCQSLDMSSYTPSDFPDVHLSQEQLDVLLAEIDLD